MNISKDDELIGMSSGEVVIHGAGTDTQVKLNPAVIQSVVARLSSAVEEVSTERVYLALESVQGTLDASVLRVYLRFPENAAADHHREFSAGSVALYGLRRASVRHAGSSKQGLQFVLDITPFFQGLNPASSALADELIVSIRPRRELPAGSTVVIGRIHIFREVSSR